MIGFFYCYTGKSRVTLWGEPRNLERVVGSLRKLENKIQTSQSELLQYLLQPPSCVYWNLKSSPLCGFCCHAVCGAWQLNTCTYFSFLMILAGYQLALHWLLMQCRSKIEIKHIYCDSCNSYLAYSLISVKHISQLCRIPSNNAINVCHIAQEPWPDDIIE